MEFLKRLITVAIGLILAKLTREYVPEKYMLFVEAIIWTGIIVIAIHYVVNKKREIEVEERKGV